MDQPENTWKRVSQLSGCGEDKMSREGAYKVASRTVKKHQSKDIQSKDNEPLDDRLLRIDASKLGNQSNNVITVSESWGGGPFSLTT